MKFRISILPIVLAFFATAAFAQSVALSNSVTPVSRLAEPEWAQRRILKRVDPNRASAEVVFLGDSITQGWEDDGKDVWAKYYAPRRALNLGLNGDRIENVLWRLGHGDFDGLSPKVVVLLIGSINAGSGQKDSPENIVAGVHALLDQISQKLPRTKILLLAIFPRGAIGTDAMRANHDQTNAFLSQLADNKRVFFLDINQRFLGADGSLAPDLLPDFLHPNANGYAAWADAMEPTLASLLGQPTLQPDKSPTPPSLVSPSIPDQTTETAPPAPPVVNAAGVVAMGKRLELFVDDFMIQKLSGDAKQIVHKPEPQEVVLTCDKPWEGNISCYFSLFEDGNRYRMYYRASHSDVYNKEGRKSGNFGIGYAESKDGVQWTRPTLGVLDFNENKQNNLINLPWWFVESFTPTINNNPNAPRYLKYIATTPQNQTLELLISANGFDWKKAEPSVIATNQSEYGSFDSQNTLFWDNHAHLYRCYYRKNLPWPKHRNVMTTTSSDLKTWSRPMELQYGDALFEELYTNAIQCYPRAPHILIGFPTVYLANAKEQVAPEFMSSRDGINFHRWTEKIIPVTAPKDRDGNRSNYIEWGILELPGRPDELSLYAEEAYYAGSGTRLRRFTYRVDGFVSASANDKGGEITTKPLTFTGKQLVINGVTKPAGSVRVEILDDHGKPVEGKILAECQPFTGDNIEHVVGWQNGADVSAMAGKTVQLRFVLQNADLYSFRFR